MATVMRKCPGNVKSQSVDNLNKIKLGAVSQADNETDRFVLDLLAQLPPSRELLRHYQDKLQQYEEEESQLTSRIEACAQLLDTGKKLEDQLGKKQQEVEGLKDDLEAVCIKLHEERRANLKLGAENDQLRIKDIESQRKLKLLLKLAGKTEAEVVAILESGGENVDKEIKKQHPKLGKLAEQASYKQQKSSKCLELEVANMEQQLLEQERLHKTQLKEERQLWRKAEKIHIQDKNELRDKISDLQASISSLENNVTILTSQLVKQKTDFRRTENKWLNDRSVLMRKIQFFEKYGTMEGTHTDQRLKERLTGRKQKSSNEDLQKLESEIEKKDKELSRNRQEILNLKNEIEKEKARSEAAANVLAKKTKAMTEQVHVLTERCERVERRKAVEVEGYQSDIKILQGKLSHLESKLLAVAESQNQEEENREILQTLRRELQAAEQRRPRQWRN